MKIRSKTPAELEHQVADYLLHAREHPSKMRAVHLGKMTQLLLEAGPDRVMADERIRQHNPLAGVDDLALFAQKYPGHLKTRSKDPRDREFYKQKTDAVERYNQEFADLVEAIDTHADTDLLPGAFATPYMIEKDGQPYIVRVIEPWVGANQVEKHIDAALRVQDIDHLEHIVAVSYKDGVTVAPLLPGKSFKQLSMTGNAERVTQTQLRELYAAMKQANERGIGFDGLGGNIFYDEQEGFSALDMEPLSERTSASIALVQQLEYLLRDAERRDHDYTQHIDRIARDAEAILAEDIDARDDLARLREIRQNGLTERGIDWATRFADIEQSWDDEDEGDIDE